MFFAEGHIDGFCVEGCAIMTQHFAQKCTGEAAQAVMSEHFAQKSCCALFQKTYCRY